MRLHGVKPQECVIFRNDKDYHALDKLRGIHRDLINLFPRADGKYKSY